MVIKATTTKTVKTYECRGAFSCAGACHRPSAGGPRRLH